MITATRMRDLLPPESREKFIDIMSKAEALLPACDDYLRMDLPIEDFRTRLLGIIARCQQALDHIDGKW